MWLCTISCEIDVQRPDHVLQTELNWKELIYKRIRLRGNCGDRKEQPRTSPIKHSGCENKRRSRPFLEGPKSRTMSSAESRWLCEEQGRELEEDLEEERGSPSSSRLSVLSSLSICSSIDSSSDSSPAESRLPRCMLTSRLRRRTLLIKVSVRCASVHNCVCDDR